MMRQMECDGKAYTQINQVDTEWQDRKERK